MQWYHLTVTAVREDAIEWGAVGVWLVGAERFVTVGDRISIFASSDQGGGHCCAIILGEVVLIDRRKERSLCPLSTCMCTQNTAS